MPKYARVLVALAAALLLTVYVFPLWRIGLVAPQYPEGLGMRIHVNTVAGATEHDLTNINNLNHYIGMKRIEPEAIPELRLMPWIVGGLVAGALLVAALGRRKPLYAWTALFAVVGVAGLVDFWLWEYDYGHNLDEATAIIKIPGMSYQPPLIGSKQLLNFTATSWPDVGGVAAGLAFLCAAVAVLLTLRAGRGGRRSAAVAAVALAAVACAAPGPRAIQYGSEACGYCRMTISDERYGAQLVTTTGKVHTFDSVECLASYYLAQDDPAVVRSVWVSDFRRPGTLVRAEDARFIRGGTQHSPMGLGLTAFAPEEDAAGLRGEFGGEPMGWPAVLALVARESAATGGAHAHDAAANGLGAADVGTRGGADATAP
ncbi:MAG TPA: nitrous oxide reductase accessory protein NosL [Gemmatimonadaceae bacterium]|nr:nitrous oxide reductase accessory protein NosL [Gemmatimonadaceae bacterium]